MSAAQLSAVFFLQTAVILAACRIVGFAARWIGQPQVVGEMIAGVLLGPSFLGLFFPHARDVLFPPDSLKVLYVGAQMGVGLYMFLVGVEFRTDLVRSRARSALAVSASGLFVPFVLGAALAFWLGGRPGLFSPHAGRFEAALFLGAAMSITAFPMLARIIHENGLAGTSLGTLALAAGAIDDMAAWCILAVVLASFGAGPSVAVIAIGGGVLYALVVTTAGRRGLVLLKNKVERAGRLTPNMLGVVLMLFMLAAWITDSIGIHAVFGGFILGAAMPRGLVAAELQRRLEPVAVVLLLPMFFTYSGLNTRLDLVNKPELFLESAAILAVASLGKGVACWAAARLTGADNRTAVATGALMNSRGLMELIILNIGLQRGVIEHALFSMMVLMAVVTTLAATPVFRLVFPEGAAHETDGVDPEATGLPAG
jgi:Kef-type K+ transport system membrane component KefB